MTSGRLITCRNVMPCLFVLLLKECLARKGLNQHEVPPTEFDENGCECIWTPWMNNDDFDARVGDDTTYHNLRRSYDFCQTPRNIKCRSKRRWQVPYRMLRVRDTTCSVENGLICFSKPFDKVQGTKETPHLCEDFEVTVQCCTCQTTTTAPETTIAITTAAKSIHNPRSTNDSAPGNIQAVNTEQNDIANETMSSNEGIPVTMILIVVFGCILTIGFVVVIWLILKKTTFHNKKRVPDQNFYRQGPANTTETEAPGESTKISVSFSAPSGSSDYLTTSSDDEGYRSRPSYNRKPRTKGRRRRKLNNGNKTKHGHASDSLGEFPTPGLRSPTDEGQSARWFPGEYERALEQKKRQKQVEKSRSIFNTPFNANSKKSIPYDVDDES